MPVVREAFQHVSDTDVHNARASWKQFVRTMPNFPESNSESSVTPLFSGRGIVMAGGGYQLDWVYATATLLRVYGCRLPIELWVSSGRGEMPAEAALRNLTQLGVTVGDVDAIAGVDDVMDGQIHPAAKGTKPYIIKQIALVSAACETCLLLDADNTPVRDPEYLMDEAHFLREGLVLWPDYWHMRGGESSIRRIFELPQGWDTPLPDKRTVESGQMVVDKRRAWQTLLLSTWMQMHTAFFDNQVRSTDFRPRRDNWGRRRGYWPAARTRAAEPHMLSS